MSSRSEVVVCPVGYFIFTSTEITASRVVLPSPLNAWIFRSRLCNGPCDCHISPSFMLVNRLSFTLVVCFWAPYRREKRIVGGSKGFFHHIIVSVTIFYSISFTLVSLFKKPFSICNITSIYCVQKVSMCTWICVNMAPSLTWLHALRDKSRWQLVWCDWF